MAYYWWCKIIIRKIVIYANIPLYMSSIYLLCISMNNKSLNFLEKNTWNDNLIVWWHPQLSFNKEEGIHIQSQKQAFLNALKIREKCWWDIVIWMSNISTYKNFIKDWSDNRKKIYNLSDMKDELVDEFRSMTNDINWIRVIFQEHANWYLKSNLKSKKLSELQRKRLSTLFTSVEDNDWEALHTTCKATAAWFIKMTQKINTSSKNILACFGADGRCAHPDIAWWALAANSALWYTGVFKFAYFDSSKKLIPMMKCS